MGATSIIYLRNLFKIFLVAKLFNVMQFIWGAHGSIQKLHWVFARYIWRSASQPRLMDNFIRRTRSGGLVDLQIYL